ncbi:MAG: ABC transporter permease [Syntrophomonas sp.]
MFRIVWNNLRRRKYHSILILASVGIATALMYSSLIMVLGVAQGIQGSINRMGADIVVIPRSGDTSLTEQILFSGRPVNEYMDIEVMRKVKEIPGVEKVSPQFFTQTLNESCCSLGNVTRVVGFDRKTDFVLKPFLDTIPGFKGELQNDQIIVGGLTNIPLGGRILVLGKAFNVVGQLKAVGGGTDTTLFVSIDQARNLVANSSALQRYWDNGKSPDQLVSAILVKVNNPHEIPDEYSGAVYTACPVIGNHHSVLTETNVPQAETDLKAGYSTLH